VKWTIISKIGDVHGVEEEDQTFVLLVRMARCLLLTVACPLRHGGETQPASASGDTKICSAASGW
jgi:hypothetical protein